VTTKDIPAAAVNANQIGCHVIESAVPRNKAEQAIAATVMYLAHGSFLLTTISQTVAMTEVKAAQ